MQVHSPRISGNFYLYTFYTVKFGGGPKSGGARAPAAPASSAPMKIMVCKANFVTPATILHYVEELCIVYYKSFQINSKRFCNLMPQNKLPTCVCRDGQKFFLQDSTLFAILHHNNSL